MALDPWSWGLRSEPGIIPSSQRLQQSRFPTLAGLRQPSIPWQTAVWTSACAFLSTHVAEACVLLWCVLDVPSLSMSCPPTRTLPTQSVLVIVATSMQWLSRVQLSFASDAHEDLGGTEKVWLSSRGRRSRRDGESSRWKRTVDRSQYSTIDQQRKRVKTRARGQARSRPLRPSEITGGQCPLRSRSVLIGQPICGN